MEGPPESYQEPHLADIVQPRYTELFELVRAEINRNGFEDKISAGIVFTGGTSKMEGVVELAESIFQTSVRLGIPNKFLEWKVFYKIQSMQPQLGSLIMALSR